jgi:hypothetical protein
MNRAANGFNRVLRAYRELGGNPVRRSTWKCVRSKRAQMVIVDFKPRARLSDEEITEHQLRIYGAGYRELTGHLPDGIEVHELESGHIRQPAVSERHVQATHASVIQAGQMVSATKLPRLARWRLGPVAPMCAECELRGICRKEPARGRALWRQPRRAADILGGGARGHTSQNLAIANRARIAPAPVTCAPKSRASLP